MQRLPPELLSEAFIWLYVRCAAPKKERLQTKSVSTVRLVCRSWNQVALLTPQLWTNLLLNLTKPWHKDRIANLESWLQQSGGCTFQLRLVDDALDADIGSRGHAGDHHRSNEQIIKRLLPNMTRCHNLSMAIPPKYIKLLLYHPSSKFSALKMLQIDGLKLYPYAFSLDFTTFPLLEWLDISLSSLRAGAAFSGITHKLKTVEVKKAVTPPDFLRMLRCCPALEYLDVDIDDWTNSHLAEELNSEPVIEVKHLMQLDLGTWNPQDLGLILDHLCLPSLTTLIIRVEDDEGIRPNQDWDHFADFLRRSRPPLTSLSFTLMDCINIRSLERIIALDMLPHLEDLTMKCFTLSEDFWAILTCRTDEEHPLGSSNLCTNLESLSVSLGTSYSDGEAPEQLVTTIAEMVLSRSQPFVPSGSLTTFVLTGAFSSESHYEEDFMKYPGISECGKFGVDIRIRDNFVNPHRQLY